MEKKLNLAKLLFPSYLNSTLDSNKVETQKDTTLLDKAGKTGCAPHVEQNLMGNF